MPDETALSQKLKVLLGVVVGSYTGDVEKGMVRRYAEAIGDTNPIYRDEDYARGSRHGGIIAPPTMPFIFSFKAPLPAMPEEVAGGGARAGNSMEFFRPMRPGDVITCTARYVDFYEREGRASKMLFRVVEYTYVDQKGEVVAIGRDTNVTFMGERR